MPYTHDTLRHLKAACQRQGYLKNFVIIGRTGSEREHLQFYAPPEFKSKQNPVWFIEDAQHGLKSNLFTKGVGRCWQSDMPHLLAVVQNQMGTAAYPSSPEKIDELCRALFKKPSEHLHRIYKTYANDLNLEKECTKVLQEEERRERQELQVDTERVERVRISQENRAAAQQQMPRKALRSR